MPDEQLINVDGLSKERIVLALYRNIYRRSTETELSQEYVMNFPQPREEQITILLSQNHNYIDYLGSIKLGIGFYNFSNSNLLCAAYYDELHSTGSNGILTAQQVIENLRKFDLEKNTKKVDKCSFFKPAAIIAGVCVLVASAGSVYLR